MLKGVLCPEASHGLTVETLQSQKTLLHRVGPAQRGGDSSDCSFLYPELTWLRLEAKAKKQSGHGRYFPPCPLCFLINLSAGLLRRSGCVPQGILRTPTEDLGGMRAVYQ